MKNIVILISGTGSNMAAIMQAAERECWIEKFGARVVAVISNRPGAGGLRLAADAGIATQVVDHTHYADRQAFDAALMRVVDSYDSALVVLAGFMRILTPEFVRHYADRILNIHPSLLPAFKGLHTHQRALDMGCKFVGATVHQVTSELDDGPIIEQAVVPVLAQDTAETLAERVRTQECMIYPKAIAKVLRTL